MRLGSRLLLLISNLNVYRTALKGVVLGVNNVVAPVIEARIWHKRSIFPLKWRANRGLLLLLKGTNPVGRLLSDGSSLWGKRNHLSVFRAWRGLSFRT